MSTLDRIVRLLDELSLDDQFNLLDILSERLHEEWGKTQASTPTPPLENPTTELERKQPWMPRLRNLIEWGLVRPGKDKLYVLGCPGEFALLIDAKFVVYQAEKLPINEWARSLRNWPSINIYDYVVVERNNLTLGQIRKQYMDTHDIDRPRRR